jgi:hypothetical protein
VLPTSRVPPQGVGASGIIRFVASRHHPGRGASGRVNPPAAGGSGHKRGRESRRRRDASPYAVLAGHPEGGAWWGTPLVSLVLAVACAVCALVTHDPARVVFLIAAGVTGLPAFFQGLFLVLFATVQVSSGAGEVPGMRAAARRVRRGGVVAIIALGAYGVVLYAIAPGVGSYQASLLLILPIFILVLSRVGRRLPTRVQWALAIPLAALGWIGYLFIGGSQWWSWGQFAVFPLATLIIVTATKRNPNGLRAQWYGGLRDGPWGPP